MCGIAGFIGSSEISPDRVRETLALMRRRGPDHADFYRHRFAPGRNVVLLHSRLSIIDPDPRSNQPFRTGPKVMVYNGELYNYLELKRDASLSNGGFRTESDTEVLLHLVARRGGQGLDRCEGMWAFAVYDESDGSLLLGRDRFGEKPLYVYRDATGLYFGSEVKFITALCGHAPEVNVPQLYRYLVNGYKSLGKSDETFFLGVRSLKPASVLRLGVSDTVEEVYWTPAFDEDGTMTREDAVEGVRERLIDAVRLRLRADVPLAFCLSGGIDSNSLAGIAKRVFGHEVHGFTIMNTDSRYAESDMIECAVRGLGLRHTEVALSTRNFLSNLRTLVRAHDAPVYTISYYAHWLLMKAVAAAGYRISVSGTAADELFSGYYDHHNAYLYEVRGDAAVYENALAAWNEHIRPIVRNPYLSNPNVFIENPGERSHIFLHADRFAEYLREPWSEPFAEERYRGGLLRNRMLNELFEEGVPPILHEDDLNAMYFSVENRSPFLDRNLVEFCNTIPTVYLVRDGYAKAVLRDAMRGIVPEPVLSSRRKVGFNAPVLSFLDPADPGTRSALLDESPIYRYVRRDKIERLLEKAEYPNSESKFLFYFLNSKIFLETFAH